MSTLGQAALPARGTTYCVARDVAVPADAAVVFDFLDDHRRLAAHMERRSWRLAFGRLTLTASTDAAGREQLDWDGRVFGLPIHATEVVLERAAPFAKRWATVGATRLWVVGDYVMSFRIAPRGDGALVRIELEYALPARGLPHVLGRLLGHGYAQWCVERMIADMRDAFVAPR